MLPDATLPWPIPMRAVAMVADFESCRLRAYRCPAGVWTLGWGETDGIVPGMTWSQAQADQRFCESLTAFTRQVQILLTAHAEPNQLGALVSLAYNIGVGALAKSSVLKAHNAGDSQAAARAFALWNKARVNGSLQVLAGLTRRRAAEAALYLTPEPDEHVERMPQAVAVESSLAASPIARGGAASTAGGLAVAAPALAPVLEQVESAKGAVASFKALAQQAQEFLGFEPLVLVGLAIVAAGWLVMRWRARQRTQGWA
jgi:lysozyme